MQKTGQFLFETELKWLQDSKGTLTSRSIMDPIKVATPKSFKGIEGGMWSPEHLLIGAVSSCFMTTFLFYAKQKGLPVTNFECEAIGLVELKSGRLKFTEINVYPKVIVEKELLTDLAKEAIELTKQNCLITSALSVIVYYHPTIELGEHLPENKQQLKGEKREFFF